MKINEQEMSEVTKKSPSWLLVIILLILFWPVGIFFLVRKLSVDKKASLNSGKKMIVWGWIIFSLGALGSCGMMDQRSFQGGSGTIFMLFAGLALVFVGRIASKNAGKYKKYINMIVNQGMRSISRIADAIPTSSEQAIQDIQDMIKKGFFKEAYINFSTNKIVFTLEEVQQKSFQSESTTNQIVVTCNGCGANNKVGRGQVGECQYCGSLISGQ